MQSSACAASSVGGAYAPFCCASVQRYSTDQAEWCRGTTLLALVVHCCTTGLPEVVPYYDALLLRSAEQCCATTLLRTEGYKHKRERRHRIAKIIRFRRNIQQFYLFTNVLIIIIVTIIMVFMNFTLFIYCNFWSFFLS
jgi:hypothetical protein